MKKKSFFVMVILIIVLLLMSGCGIGVESQQEPASASVTPSPAATPTATPSPTPDPSAIAAASEKAAMEELDKRIQAFLNYQSEYAPESITYISGAKEINKLGLLNDIPKVEGVLLGHVDRGDHLLLIVGFDGKDDKRFVVPIEIATYPFADPDPMVKFRFKQYSAPIVDYEAKEFSTKSKEEISSILSELENNVISFSLFTNVDNDALERYKDNPLVVRQIKEINSNIQYARSLSMKVAGNDIDVVDFEIPEDIKLDEIDSYADISKIDSSYVLNITLIGFFKKDFKGIVK
jgi:hypothetical protein